MIEHATIAQPRLTAGGPVRIPPEVAELAEKVLRGEMTAAQANRTLRRSSRIVRSVRPSAKDRRRAALAGARARLRRYRADNAR